MDEAIVSAIAGLRTRIADLERLEFSITGSHGGALADAQYVTMALNAALTQERILTAGILLGLTDGGAGGAATLDVELHHVIKISSTSTEEYAVSNAGLTAALAAAASGDVITSPYFPYTCTVSVPAGVALIGVGRPTTTGQVTLGNGSSLDGFFVARSDSSGTLIGVLGPGTGTAYIWSCTITATNNGGNAYAVQGNGGVVDIWESYLSGTGSALGFGIYSVSSGVNMYGGYCLGSTAPTFGSKGSGSSYGIGVTADSIFGGNAADVLGPPDFTTWVSVGFSQAVNVITNPITSDGTATIHVWVHSGTYIRIGVEWFDGVNHTDVHQLYAAPGGAGEYIYAVPAGTYNVIWAGSCDCTVDAVEFVGGTALGNVVLSAVRLSDYSDADPGINSHSAWNVDISDGWPERHASDLRYGLPTAHLPEPLIAGTLPIVGADLIYSNQTPAAAGMVSGAGIVGRLAEWVTDTHTLQAANLIGPAANVLTLTATAASTLALAITAAKTLTLTATDDYNLTVPATGTAALLAIANIFTRKQTITGSADEVQLTVTGFTTQSTGAAVEKIARNDTAAGISPVLDLVGLGSGAAGDGVSLRMLGKSSTTAERALAAILADWYNPTDASRVSEIVFDTFFGANPLEALRLRGNNALVGSALLVGSNSVVNNSLLAFNGLSTNVNCGDLTELNSAATFSISTWANEAVVPAIDNLFVKSLGTNDRIQAAFSTTSNRLFVYVCSGSNSFGQLDNYDTYIVAGRWHHIVVVYDGGGVANADRLKLYIDNVYIPFTSFNGTIPATTSNLAGANFLISSSSNSIEGYIKRFRIYSSAITAGNVTTLFQGIDFSTNLIHYYKLDEGVGTVAYDTGSNPMNGTIGAGSWTTSGYSGLGTTFPTTRLALYASTTRDGGISFGNDTWLYRSAAGTLTLNGLGYTALIAGSNGSAATLGLFGVAAIARPTTAIAAAAFVQNSGNAINDASTIGGYTLLQVVKALQNLGALT